MTVAALTAASLALGVTSPASAAPVPSSAAAVTILESSAPVPALTVLQSRFLHEEAGRLATAGGQQRAFPIAAVAIAAAAWCAKGALARIPTSALSDILAGRASSRSTYVRNAVIGCIGGEIGGVVWRFLPAWVKDQAVQMVISFIIRYLR